MAISWTQAHYNQLLEAIATGAEEIEYADKKVKYRGLTEMRALLLEMGASLAGSPRDRRKVASIGNGHYPNT